MNEKPTAKNEWFRVVRNFGTWRVGSIHVVHGNDRQSMETWQRRVADGTVILALDENGRPWPFPRPKVPPCDVVIVGCNL